VERAQKDMDRRQAGKKENFGRPKSLSSSFGIGFGLEL
jgi:hypothetical protein